MCCYLFLQYARCKYYCLSSLACRQAIFVYLEISRLKGSSANITGDGPVGFLGIRASRGGPYRVTEITNLLELPVCISSVNEEFCVGSLITHINGICICKTVNNIPSWLNAPNLTSISFVNSLEAWDVVKNQPQAAVVSKIRRSDTTRSIE